MLKKVWIDMGPLSLIASNPFNASAPLQEQMVKRFEVAGHQCIVDVGLITSIEIEIFVILDRAEVEVEVEVAGDQGIVDV